MTDCCIIGGGIIGLSIARELADRGLSVRVLARDATRDTASWAAAGIFPPAPDFAAASANERLTAYSDRLHRTWAEELRSETGIDNELGQCGGLCTVSGLMPRIRSRIHALLVNRASIPRPGPLDKSARMQRPCRPRLEHRAHNP